MKCLEAGYSQMAKLSPHKLTTDYQMLRENGAFIIEVSGLLL